jgi:DNA-binding NarL/FixJ family response regulator
MSSSQAYVQILEQDVPVTPPSPRRRQASGPGSPPALRAAAIEADRATSTELNLALLWRELMTGLCQVVDGFFTQERCYVVLLPVTTTVSPVDERRRQILEAVLRGQGQKNVATGLRLAASTIALNSRLALRAIGVSAKPSRVHPLLMLAAVAAGETASTTAASISFIEAQGELLRVVAMARPDRRLAEILPPAELAAVQSLVTGQSYAEIARARGTSTRTIANQITAVFRRMGVSGRSELLQRLFYSEGLICSQPPPSSRRGRAMVLNPIG